MRNRYTLRQILIANFSFVCVLPLAVLALWLLFSIQQNALDQAREKNQILAQNLTVPIHAHLLNARQTLANLSLFLGVAQHHKALANVAQNQHYFRSIFLLTEDGSPRRLTRANNTQTGHGDARLYALAAPYFSQQTRTQSHVIRDPYTGEPTLLFVEPVGKRLLVGLLDLQPIISLGRQVRFGREGYAAITDQYGNTVFHPNLHWVTEMHSMADWDIIRLGQQGKTGVLHYAMPNNQAMVAGYAAVAEFKWVVITPQPLAEFRAHAHALLRTAAWAAGAAAVIALVLAIAIACWVAHPIAVLAKTVQRLPDKGYREDFAAMANGVPREFDTLHRSIRDMAQAARTAIEQRDAMNNELAQLVERATRGLRDANTQLTQQALIDDLTQLSNRRALWQRISDLEQAPAESYLPVQVLLFDLDNFKEVNDTLGHAAGDQVLMHIAAILEQETRAGDFVVRYGGDEFLVILYRCTPEKANERAELICRAVRSQPLIINDKTIVIDMSVGIAESESTLSRPSFNELLKAADQAMYVSKAKNKRNNPLYCI